MAPETEHGIKIVLTPMENDLFNDITSMITAYGLPITVRVAGGWVRDKVSFES